MRSAFLFLFLVLMYQTFSQINGVFVSDFKLDNSAEKWCWAIEQDGHKNLLFGVTNGVVVFDGQNQHFIKLPFTPTDILSDPSKERFYICGYEHAGYLSKVSYANYQYNELALSVELEYNKIIEFNDTVLFISPSQLVRFDSQQLQLIDSILTDDVFIEETFTVNNQLYFIIDYFPHIIQNGAFKEIENIDFPVDEFSYTVPVSENEVLLGTLGNTIYYFDGKKFKTRTIKKSAFFDNNIIVDAARYNDSTVLLSSLAGGIALFDIYKQEIIKQLSYFNGLPDDEIRTFFIDSDKAIWVSHEFGISRIDFGIGIESYSFYPGLKGTPTAVSFYNNQLFVATSNGLFALSEVKDYNEFEVSVDVPVDVTVAVPGPGSQTETIQNIEVSEEQKDNNKSLFSFLSKKRKKQELTNEPDEASGSLLAPQVKKKEVEKTAKRIVKKRSLKSVSHYFTLIDGINDKCSQLVPYENGLLVAGNNGLYVVENKKGKKIISNVYVYNIYYSHCCNKAYISTSNGLYRVYKKGASWEFDHFSETTMLRIHAVANEQDDIWVVGFDNMIMRARIHGENIEVINQTNLIEAPGRSFFIKHFDDKMLIIGANSVYEFTTEGELLLVEDNSFGKQYLGNQADYLWKFDEKGWNVLTNLDANLFAEQSSKLNLFNNIRYINVALDNNLWIITENNSFYKISKDSVSMKTEMANFLISNVYVNGEVIDFSGNFELKPNQKHIVIHVSAPFYFQQNGVQYRYKVDGLYSDFTNWSKTSKIELNYLPPGNFKLILEAKNGFGKSTVLEPARLKIAKPFTQSFTFIMLIVIAMGAIIYLVLRMRLKKLQHDKEVLEQKVKERTKTIEEQKERIEKQHDEITQSIRYAKRIQTAMLPNDEIIEAMIPDHFILFKPRDIVSGDFYFFKPLGKKVVLIAADCTGHGVPGGFMSMLGISYLMEITSQVPYPSASEILNLLREKIKLTLGQSGAESTQKDGMDMSVSLIDIDNRVLEFAGAFNPLYIIRNNELETIKADRQPVSVYFKEGDFTNHTIEIQKGDVFYMFSDGYQDQIGGPSQRKFMTKNFKSLLLDIYKMPMAEQKTKLDETLEKWKGDSMQVDDILVIGYKI